MRVIDAAVESIGSARFSPEEWSLRCELAAAYRLVAEFGWSDLLSTHISARIPGPEDHFLINPYGLLFDEMTASDLVKVDQSGSILSDTGYAINPAGFVIHSCIHAARRDVGCVLHLHSRDGVAVATQDCGLLPATQHALMIWEQIAYHEFEGPALDLEEQKRLVADLGRRRILILRNHGTLTAGRTIADAFVTMYRLERACRMQIAAQSSGQRLHEIPQSVIDASVTGARTLLADDGFAPLGQKEWRALIRRLDRNAPDYRR